MALTAALATATRALEVFSTAVQVSAQNIANSSTPGYIREQLTLESTSPFRQGNVIVGSGVRTTAVKQVIDQFLEQRIHASSSDAAAAKAREDIYAQLELELRELGDSDLSSRLNSFVSAINEVVNQPEEGPLRTNLIAQGRLVAENISSLRNRIDSLRESQTSKINNLVTESNRLIDTVEKLNKQIASQEANGLQSSDAGALRTQRYTALQRLSQIVPVHYNESSNGSVDIYSGGDYLLFAGSKQHLETQAAADRGVAVQTVRFANSRTPLSQPGGEIQGVIEGRDKVLGGFVDELDQIAGALIFEFNKLHSSGEGIEGFTSVTGTEQLDDPNTLLNAGGLPFTPQHGSFDIKVVNKLTGNVETSTIRIDLDGIGGDDTTLEDLRSSLDGVDNLSASLTNGRLRLDADSNFEIRFRNDTSGALAALGINSFFTGADSKSIDINETVASNRNLFAAGQGGGAADNRNAIELAQILDRPVASLTSGTISDAYDSAITSIAQGAASDQATAQGLLTFRDSLLAQREQFSGVSLDEEAVKLIEFQQAFAASARVIRTVDELFQLLISL